MAQLRYALYVRKSTESEDRQVLSIDSQIERAHEMFHDVNIVEVIEEKHSAFEPGKRVKFAKLIDDIDAGRIDGIIAWHPDRLSRNEEDAAKITYRVRKGILRDLRFCSYHFVNSPEGIMMLQLALSQSQYMSSKLGADVRRGMNQKLKLGWRPGLAAIGYLNVMDGPNHIIAEDPHRFPLVRRMWDLLLTGLYSPDRITQIAETEWGLTTLRRRRLGGTPLVRSAVYRILRDPFYAGLIRWDGEIYKGRHKAMVTLDEFKKAQQILDGRTSCSPGRALITRDFAYRGLITCAECGCQYTAEVKKNHSYYHCTRRRKKIFCTQRKNIREEEILSYVLGVMRQHSIHPSFREWALAYVAESKGSAGKQDAKVKKSRAERLQQLRHQIDRLLDMKLDDLIDDDAFRKKQRSMKESIEELEGQLTAAEEAERRAGEQTRRALNLAAFGLDVLQHGTNRKKRMIVNAIAQTFTAREGKVSLIVRDWIVPFSKEVRGNASKIGPRPARSRRVRTNISSDFSSTQRKTAVSAAVLSSWQGIVDEVRTRLSEAPMTFSLPEFDLLGDLVDPADPADKS
ncbi:recombinase family protein [Streptomyces canus]|uniref:recombinase family protein n=1 Tax=Streptomyces canus TaxID=58343 RepID=UPI0030E4ED04